MRNRDLEYLDDFMKENRSQKMPLEGIRQLSNNDSFYDSEFEDKTSLRIMLEYYENGGTNSAGGGGLLQMKR